MGTGQSKGFHCIDFWNLKGNTIKEDALIDPSEAMNGNMKCIDL